MGPAPMMPAPEATNMDMMKTLVEAIGGIQTKLSELSLNSEAQQTAIQNTHSVMVQLQQAQNEQAEKISAIEKIAK